MAVHEFLCQVVRTFIVAFISASYNFQVISAYQSIKDCGLPGVTHSSFSGGESVEDCEFPWMVSVQTTSNLCEGFLVNERTVVTSAHCLYNTLSNSIVDPDEMKVLVPPSNKGNYQQYEVRKKFLHSAYNGSNNSYDIAVLVLSDRVFFSKCLRPLCLPKPEQKPPKSCIYLHWNGLEVDSQPVNMIKHKFTSMLSDNTCRNQFQEIYNDQVICAGNAPRNLSHINSRGPLICQVGDRYAVFGISAFSSVLHNNGVSYAFIKTSHPHVLSFITDHMDLCGISEVSSRRIIGGTAADECEFPWMVAVEGSRLVCGGCILDEWTVLTSAHCLVDVNTRIVDDHAVVLVYAGASDKMKLKAYPIQRVFVHPQYYDQLQKYDIALVFMKSSLRFWRCESPICLPEAGEEPPDDCIVAGWGMVNETAEISPKYLHKVILPRNPHESCDWYYTSNNNDRYICAGDAEKGVCFGDSGSPFACLVNHVYVTFGLVQSGLVCGDKNYTGILKKLSHPSIMKFIHSTIAEFEKAIAENGFFYDTSFDYE